MHLEEKQEINFEDRTIIQEVIDENPNKNPQISFVWYNQQHEGLPENLFMMNFQKHLHTG